MPLKLTVVDQSPVHGTSEACQAPLNSIALAKACDTLGYYRYWVAEHHDSIQFAGPCPEILVASIASQTRNMRIGSGGVMLTHYSAYKVAETFRMLSSLHPNRIDLGIGRAPGGTHLASTALASPHGPTEGDHFPRQAAELCAFLRHQYPEDHPYRQLKCLPDDNPKPELWMLGSGGGSSALAGHLGINLAVAKFIAPDHCSPKIFDSYAEAFKNANHQHPMQKMLAVAIICAETDEEAKFIAGPAAYRKVMTRFGAQEPIQSPRDAIDKRNKMSASQQAAFDATINKMIHGSPGRCWDQLHAHSKEYNTEEIALVTVTYDYDSRLKSYQLLGEALST